MMRRLLLSAALAAVARAATAQVGPIPGYGPLPPAAVTACSAPVVTNIGTASNLPGATVTLTGVTVPAGALIVVVVNEANNTFISPSSMTDGTNTYSFDTNTGDIYYVANASALSGATITYTKQISGDDTVISAFYATNIAASSPIDSATHGLGSTTVTSGTPVQSGELFVAQLFVESSAAPTITQDTGDGWVFPPNTVSLFDGSTLFQTLSGGTQVNVGTGTKTYTPTITGGGTIFDTATQIIGFKHC